MTLVERLRHLYAHTIDKLADAPDAAAELSVLREAADAIEKAEAERDSARITYNALAELVRAGETDYQRADKARLEKAERLAEACERVGVLAGSIPWDISVELDAYRKAADARLGDRG